MAIFFPSLPSSFPSFLFHKLCIVLRLFYVGYFKKESDLVHSLKKLWFVLIFMNYYNICKINKFKYFIFHIIAEINNLFSTSPIKFSKRKEIKHCMQDLIYFRNILKFKNNNLNLTT